MSAPDMTPFAEKGWILVNGIWTMIAPMDKHILHIDLKRKQWTTVKIVVLLPDKFISYVLKSAATEQFH